MKEVAVTEVKEELAKYLKLAQKEAIVITRRGKPVGVLTAFQSEDDLFDYLLVNDPRFLKRIKQAEKSVEESKGIRLENVEL
ncbi:MAG: type II toxin-antitoxin system Phd/YefM family antitoxin [Chloroflexi bacterium]|nr:type II toxin-antitoxin system Phd/YefM family antitoxin [Chloroflexota bacterium]